MAVDRIVGEAAGTISTERSDSEGSLAALAGISHRNLVGPALCLALLSQRIKDLPKSTTLAFSSNPVESLHTDAGSGIRVNFVGTAF